MAWPVLLVLVVVAAPVIPAILPVLLMLIVMFVAAVVAVLVVQILLALPLELVVLAVLALVVLLLVPTSASGRGPTYLWTPPVRTGSQKQAVQPKPAEAQLIFGPHPYGRGPRNKQPSVAQPKARLSPAPAS